MQTGLSEMLPDLHKDLQSQNLESHNGETSNIDWVKKNQLDAQLILSIFRQPLQVSDVSRPIIWRYNRMYTTIGTYYSF